MLQFEFPDIPISYVNTLVVLVIILLIIIVIRSLFDLIVQIYRTYLDFIPRSDHHLLSDAA